MTIQSCYSYNQTNNMQVSKKVNVSVISSRTNLKKCYKMGMGGLVMWLVLVGIISSMIP